MGFGSADDPLWEQFKAANAVGPLFKTSQEWLPGARSVIAFFAPFSDYVVSGNRGTPREPGSSWLCAYRWGEPFLKDGSHCIEDVLRAAGYEAFDPYASDAFTAVYRPGSTPDIGAPLSFTSNWSVRHAAYVCGLGTFGLSKGLITRHGTAGRFGAVITTADFVPDERKYSGLYDWCVTCGKCAQNCPAHAISREHGKNHEACLAWLEEVEKRYPLCDACGKCQTAVPCERKAPGLHQPQRNIPRGTETPHAATGMGRKTYESAATYDNRQSP